MQCPNCSGQGCGTCGNEGTVPDWLADPNVNGSDAASTWTNR
jgi:hypothetical protein